MSDLTAQVQTVVDDWVRALQESGPVPGAHGQPTDVLAEAGAAPGQTMVQLPGSTRIHVPVSVIVGARTLSASAFVCRNPDENHEAVYRWLLRRNARLRFSAFSIDTPGDIYLTGYLPLAAVTADSLDALMGEILQVADESFNDLIGLGFLSGLRTELAWRTARGLPTHNLDAFRHLLEEAGPAPRNEAGRR